MRAWPAVFALLFICSTAHAASGFLGGLAGKDFSEAGLKKLTPQELAHLEALIEKYKTTEVAQVEQQAEAKVVAVRQEAEVQVKAAIAKAEAPAAAAPAAEPVAPGKKQPAWYSALLNYKKATEKPGKKEPLESALVGDFTGWHGRTIFRLQNGTQWQQQNASDSYVYSPARHSPKVKITPAAFNGFWMEIEGVNLSVRVIPFDLGPAK